jgi:hypothetical protein
MPAELNISSEEAKKITLDLAKERLSNSLITAVSLLRQKKPADVVSHPTLLYVQIALLS